MPPPVWWARLVARLTAEIHFMCVMFSGLSTHDSGMDNLETQPCEPASASKAPLFEELQQVPQQATKQDDEVSLASTLSLGSEWAREVREMREEQEASRLEPNDLEVKNEEAPTLETQAPTSDKKQPAIEQPLLPEQDAGAPEHLPAQPTAEKVGAMETAKEKDTHTALQEDAVQEDAPQEDAVQEEYAVREDAVQEECAVREDALQEEYAVRENALQEEYAVREDALQEECAVREDALQEECAVREDALQEEHAVEDALQEDGLQEDALPEEAAHEDAVQEVDLEEDAVQDAAQPFTPETAKPPATAGQPPDATAELVEPPPGATGQPAVETSEDKAVTDYKPKKKQQRKGRATVPETEEHQASNQPTTSEQASTSDLQPDAQFLADLAAVELPAASEPKRRKTQPVDSKAEEPKPEGWNQFPYISPETQCPGKRRGRKPKEPAAKEQQSAASAPKGKASAKNKAKAQGKANKGGGATKQPKGAAEAKSSKLGAASDKRKAPEADLAAESKKRARKPAAAQPAKGQKRSRGEGEGNELSAAKARLSRKSSAYHKERARMLKGGASPEEAKLAASKVPSCVWKGKLVYFFTHHAESPLSTWRGVA